MLNAADARLIAEQVADVMLERGLVAASPPAGRVLDTTQVAQLLGRDRSWVYQHAAELGAFRMGTGPKARLGFDEDAIAAWKRQRAVGLPGLIPDARPIRRRPACGARTAELIDFDEAAAR